MKVDLSATELRGTAALVLSMLAMLRRRVRRCDPRRFTA